MCQSGEIHQINAVGGGKQYTMVMMLVGRVASVLDGILYYSYCRKPMGREFFIPAQTLMSKAVETLTGSGNLAILSCNKIVHLLYL